jgi:hypothetical protein
MALIAAAFPIPPGKTEDWKRWQSEINGARRREFVASRKALGVRERTFLQSTPMGDLVIVTVEGDDPAGFFARLGGATDAFNTWFLGKVHEIHGIDLAGVTAGPPISQLVVDSAG